jgi:hypothetical protein
VDQIGDAGAAMRAPRGAFEAKMLELLRDERNVGDEEDRGRSLRKGFFGRQCGGSIHVEHMLNGH